MKPKIVVIGGGTGSYVVLSGLKKYPVDLTALIGVTDSGGSTGRLRDEFGFQPVGDLRQALAALASDQEHAWIQKLLLYRFTKGSGLEGHNLGNLILTALQDLTESTPEALEVAAKVFRLHGSIYPITTKNIQLVVEYEDGTVEIGEKILDESKHGGEKITKLAISPRASVYEKAKQAILEADLIILGPGDLYASIISNLVVEGVKEALTATKARLIYIENLMTHYSQTHNMTANDHLEVVQQAIGRSVDEVVINSAPISAELEDMYARQHEFQVKDDLHETEQTRITRAPLITTTVVGKDKSDILPRSYLRHDSTLLAKIIWDYLNE